MFHNILKTIPIIIIFHFHPIFGQNLTKGSFALDDFYLQLNSLRGTLKENNDSIHRGDFSIGNFKFGFNDINLKHSNKKTQLSINGPNLNINDFNFNINYTLPNYYGHILSDLSEYRNEIPFDGLEVIQQAITAFKSKNGNYPESYNDLIVDSFINTTLYPFNKTSWSYHFFLPDSVIAKSTSQHIYQKTNTIILDWQTKKIIKRESDNFNKDLTNWELKFKIYNIEQNFLSDLTLNYDSEFLSYDFYLKRGRFIVEGFNVYLIPNKNIFEQTFLKINNLNFSINDFHLQAVEVKNKLLVNTLKADFILRNFEIKIPKLLLNDETISSILKDLGVRNGLIRVRELSLKVNFYDNEFGSFATYFISPFLKIRFEGDIAIDTKKQPNLSSMDLYNTELRINPISYGVRAIIRNWELENNIDLKRNGSEVILKFTGPVSSPQIDGIIYK